MTYATNLYNSIYIADLDIVLDYSCLFAATTPELCFKGSGEGGGVAEF